MKQEKKANLLTCLYVLGVSLCVQILLDQSTLIQSTGGPYKQSISWCCKHHRQSFSKDFQNCCLREAIFILFDIDGYVLAYDPFPDNKIPELHVLFNSVLNIQDNDRHDRSTQHTSTSLTCGGKSVKWRCSDRQITIKNPLVQEEKQCRPQYEQEALLFLEPIHLQLIQCSRRSITHSSIYEYNTQFAILIQLKKANVNSPSQLKF